MKPFAVLGLSLFLSGVLYAQFGSRVMLETVSRGITDIAAGDLNQDGKPDIVVSQKGTNRLVFYPAGDSGGFSPAQPIATMARPQTVAVGDLNQDGLDDIVAASFRISMAEDTLYFFRNDSGGAFTPVVIDTFSALAHKISDVELSDMNGDGVSDVITMADVRLTLYVNNGHASFSRVILSPVLSEYYELSVADLDGNGFPDVIVGGVKTFVWMNDSGVLMYDSARSASIASEGLVFLVHAADFDGDGDADLVLSDKSNTRLQLYENNGNGFFSVRSVIQTDFIQCKSMASADFDGDGDRDILTAFPQQGRVVWYANAGDGTFGAAQTIDTAVSPSPRQVHAAELNRDGGADVIWADPLSVHFNARLLRLRGKDAAPDVRVFPNPAGAVVTVQMPTAGTLSVWNALGAEIRSGIALVSGVNRLRLNLKPGLYLLDCRTPQGRVMKTLLIR